MHFNWIKKEIKVSCYSNNMAFYLCFYLLIYVESENNNKWKFLTFKIHICSCMKLYRHPLLVGIPLPFPSYFIASLLICFLLSGCVCSLWLCFQCWEQSNFVLHRFLYTFLRQHPSVLKSEALQQCTRPESPSGKEKPADCLPKKLRKGGIRPGTW